MGHALVSRAGDWDYSPNSVKVPKYLLIATKRLSIHFDSRTVVMEVETR